MQPVYVATIEHEHGTNVYVGATYRAALHCVAAFCRDWWSEVGKTDAPPPDMDDSRIVATYFAAQRILCGESYAIEPVEVAQDEDAVRYPAEATGE